MNNDFIILKTGRNEFKKVNIQNIIFVKAEGNYTKVITNDDEILVSTNLKTTLNGNDFKDLIKINRSVFVNVNKIEQFKTGKNCFVKLNNGEKFKPSSQFITNITNKFIYTVKG